ncbi:hypothetical protein ABTD83_22070, partial [Acinetobacter baumannii]
VSKVSYYDGSDQFMFFNYLEYDSHGNIILNQDSAGRKVQSLYDANDNLISQIGPDSRLKTDYVYNANNQLVKKIFN